MCRFCPPASPCTIRLVRCRPPFLFLLLLLLLLLIDVSLLLLSSHAARAMQHGAAKRQTYCKYCTVCHSTVQQCPALLYRCAQTCFTVLYGTEPLSADAGRRRTVLRSRRLRVPYCKYCALLCCTVRCLVLSEAVRKTAQRSTFTASCCFHRWLCGQNDSSGLSKRIRNSVCCVSVP